MALKVQITLENGIVLNYHRIVSLNAITNVTNIIEVASYTDENQRKKEQEYQEILKKKNYIEENIEETEETLTEEEQAILDKGLNVYIDTQYINTEYDEEMSIKTAYDYLKTLPEFENAENI